MLQHVTARWHVSRNALLIRIAWSSVMSVSRCAACGAIVAQYDTTP
jgi:hypothetical protein